MNSLAFILAGGRGSNLDILSHNRAESALPFAGKYRVIDFALSNCANSGVFQIGILTQYQPHSLNQHIRTGRPWDLDRTLSGGVTLLPPYQRNGSCMDWYHGTADAVCKNLDFVQRHGADTVLVLSGDHVYKMDYEPLLRFHQQRQADATICVIDRPPEQTSQLVSLGTDANGRVVTFQPRSLKRSKNPFSMGVYVFRTDVLMRHLVQDAQMFDSLYDFDRDVLPQMLKLGDRLYAYPFEGYWADVNTVQAYWEANMALLSANPPLDIQDRGWRIRTRSEERPPVNIGASAVVSNSFIANGCTIQGWVEHSVLSPGVRVEPGAVVRDSIIFNDCVIQAGAVVDRAVLDKNVVVGKQAYIGFENGASGSERPAGLDAGITLVGENIHLPAGLRVSRNRSVHSDPTADDFRIDRHVKGTHQTSDPAPSLSHINGKQATLYSVAR